MAEYAPTTDDPAAWWDRLEQWHKNQLRYDAQLPTRFKTEQPWAKIAPKDQATILALRPAFDAKQAEIAARIAASERKTTKIKARLEAGYQRYEGESDEDYFARCIEAHYTLTRDEDTESWTILRRLLPPLCREAESIAVPLPKSSKIEHLTVNLLRTPCGWTTGRDWSLSGWMGGGSSASIWPEAVDEDRSWYHATRDAALASIVARLQASFKEVSERVNDSVGTDSARKSCADAVPLLAAWLATVTTTEAATLAPAQIAAPKAKAVQLDLFGV